MKMIIKNEVTFGLIEEMLKIGLNNDEGRLQNEYRIAKQLAHDLLSAVEPHDINVVDVAWFDDEAKRGLQFYAVMLGQEIGTRKNSAGRKLYVKFDGKQVRVAGIEELSLFVLFQKCRRLECYPDYEKKLLREMFKAEGFINLGRSVITSAQTTNYLLFKLSELSPEMRATLFDDLFDENGELRELVIDQQWYRDRILAAAGCL